MTNVGVKAPKECEERELRAFYDLVQRGGEVDEGGLLRRIRKAKALAFACEDGDLIGAAALKIPSDGHRQRVFENAQAGLSPSYFPYELGWIFVSETNRKRGWAKTLVTKLLKGLDDSIYATVRTTNLPMCKILTKVGFERCGVPFPSALKSEELLTLFVRTSSKGGEIIGEPREVA